MARRSTAIRSVRSALASAIRQFQESPQMLPVNLRSYQVEALEATAVWLEDPKGPRMALVNWATGLGKTILEAVLASVGREELNTLYIVPNKLLVAQTARQIAKLTGTLVGQISSMGAIKDGEEVVAVKGHHNHSIVITTEASFKRRAEQLGREFKPQLIIRDECHWSYTERGQDALEHFPQAIVIGFSATPDFLTTSAKPSFVPVTLDNGQVLYAPEDRLARTYYPQLLDRRSVRWGIEEGHLAPLAWAYVEFNLDLSDVPVTDTPLGMDYDPEELRKVMEQNWPLMEDTIVRLYAEGVYDLGSRKVCAMCPGVAEANSLANKLSRFVKTAVITGDTSDDDRDAILASYESDEPDAIRFLSSVFVLREGWDSRVAEVALMLRPTKSRVLYEQFLGRILRPRRDGKEKVALALDAHFLGTKLHPLNVPTLYGAPGEEVVPGEIFLGPKRSRGSKLVSPYRLPSHIKPSLHIVQAVGIDYWAGEDGFFEADGERWGTLRAWHRNLGISRHAIAYRFDRREFRRGRESKGHVCDFYPESEIRLACSDLLEELSQATEEGFFQACGERWGTSISWSRELGISVPTTESCLKALDSKRGKVFNGRVCDFYPEAKVLAACAKFVKSAPQADKEGFFKADGEDWGMVTAWSLKLGVSQRVVTFRLLGKAFRKGKDQRGRIHDFYSESMVRETCGDLFQRPPKAGKGGFFRADGKRWGTVRAWSRLLKIGTRLLSLRLKNETSREGRICIGTVHPFYAESVVREACKDLLAKKKPSKEKKDEESSPTP